MSLMKCPDCGKDVSDQAPSCPNCGRPLPLAKQPQPSTPAGPKTSLTKPAGCFLQAISPVIVLIGLALVAGRTVGGVIFGILLMVLGVWLFIQGGKPARAR